MAKAGCCESATGCGKGPKAAEITPGFVCKRTFLCMMPLPGDPVDQTLGIHMRKCALFIAVVMVATAPTVAFAAKKKAAAPKKYDTNAANMNDSNQRFVRAVWSLPGQVWVSATTPKK